MFEALSRLFSGTKPDLGYFDNQPQVAVAALLVHLAAIDGAIKTEERVALKTALQQFYDLDEASVDSLITEAARQDADAVDFYKFTSALIGLEMEQRIEIIRMMWQVVFADNKNHELEDNMVWRIAELIGVSARDRTILRSETARA